MADLLFEAFFIALFMASTFAAILIVMRAYYWLLRSSYASWSAGTIAFGGWFSLFALALYLTITLIPAAAQMSLWGPLWIVEPSLLASTAVTFLIAKILPKRNYREGPKPRRWTEWRITRVFERCSLWIGVALVLTGVAGLFSSSDKSLMLKLIKLSVFFIAAPKLIEFIRKIEAKPTASELVHQDQRPCAIYIRAFRADGDFFTYGSKAVMEKYIPDEITLNSPAYTQANLEQYLEPSFSRWIGPFIALGNPRDRTKTAGAARDYQSDRDWKQIFLGHAQQSKAIVMQPTASNNLLWEIQQIVANHWQTRLFILQRPLPKSRAKPVRLLFEALAWARYIERPSWAAFAQWMTSCGLKLPTEDPGPGSILSFSSDGASILLTTGADEPDEFLLPIAAWLEQNQEHQNSTIEPPLSSLT
jgi:hypothetical protein